MPVRGWHYRGGRCRRVEPVAVKRLMLGPDFQRILCPYCNEVLDIVVDASVDQQEYIEDCQVCCRPITLLVQVDSDAVSVEAFTADERA